MTKKHGSEPMLGHRGVRLGITFFEIYSFQIEAVLEGAALCAKEGIEVYLEIMVPQVATVEELKRSRDGRTRPSTPSAIY